MNTPRAAIAAVIRRIEDSYRTPWSEPGLTKRVVANDLRDLLTTTARHPEDTMTTEIGAIHDVLHSHRADGWSCSCGWPLNDSIGSWVDHLAAQIEPLMRCSTTDPEGSQCRLFPGHDGQHGDGLGAVWDRDYPPGAPS